MKAAKWFKGLLDKYEDDLEYRMEKSIFEFNEKISAKMEEKNITRAELSRKLGVSKAFITKLLNGNPNLTIRTMVSIADALGCDLSLDIYPKGFEARHIYISKQKKAETKMNVKVKTLPMCKLVKKTS